MRQNTTYHGSKVDRNSNINRILNLKLSRTKFLMVYINTWITSNRLFILVQMKFFAALTKQSKTIISN